MPYSIRAEDGTLIQNIDDGVDPETALADFKKQSSPQSWGDTFLGSVQAIPKKLGQVAATLSRVSAESELESIQHPSGAFAFKAPPEIQAQIDEQKAKRAEELKGRISSAVGANKELEQAAQESLPGQQSLGQKVVSTAIVSAPSMVAGIGAGIATRNPAIGWAVGGGTGGLQQATDTMEEVRQRGGSLSEQKRHGAIQGTIEGMFEKLPIEAAMKFGTPIITRMIKTGLAESTQELATEATQIGYEKATYKPELTAKEAAERLFIAWASGGMTGSAISGAYHPVVRLQEKAIEQRLRGLTDSKPAVDAVGQAEKIPQESTIETSAAPTDAGVLNEPQEPAYTSRRVDSLTPNGLEFDPESGTLRISNTPNIGYTELPLDVRLQALSAVTEQENFLRSQPVGFNATAEEKIQQRGKIQALQQQQQEMMQQVLSEYQTNEASRPMIYNWAMQHGISVPETPNVVQPATALEGRTGLEQATMEGLGARQLDTNMYLEPGVREFYGMSPQQESVKITDSAPFPGALSHALNAGNVFHMTSDGSGSYLNVPDFDAKAAPNSAAYVTDDPNDVANVTETKQAQKLLEVGKEIVNKVLPGKKFVLYQNRQTRADLYTNSHVWLYGDTVVVMLPKTAPMGITTLEEVEYDPMTEFTRLLTVSHEVGHAVMGYEFAKADPVIQQKLWDEWATLVRMGSLRYTTVTSTITDEELKEHFPGFKREDIVSFVNGMRFVWGPKVSWLAKKVFAPYRYKDFMDKGFGDRSILEVVDKYKTNGENWFAYALSFDEYLAEQTSKYFLTRGGVVKGTEGFFKNAIRTLVKVFQAFKAQFTGYEYAAQVNFSQWMDGLVAKNSLMQGAQAQETDVEGYKKALYDLGAPPELVQALSAVGDQPYQISVMQELQKLLTVDPATLLSKEQAQAKAISRIYNNLQDKAGMFRRVELTDRAQIKKALLRYMDPEHKEIVNMLMALPEFNRQGPIDPDLLVRRVFDWLNPYHVQYENAGNKIAINVIAKGSKREVLSFYADQMLFSPDTLRIVSNPNVGTLNINEQRAIEMAVDSALAGKGYHKIIDVTGEGRSIPMWAYAEEGTDWMSHSLWSGIQNINNRLGLNRTSAASMPRDVVKYNWWLKWSLSAFQLAKLNLHIPGVKEIRQALRNKMMYKAEWLRQADEIVETWAYHLPKKDQDILGQLLYDEARLGDVAKTPSQRQSAWQSIKVRDPNNPNGYIFQPTKQAMQTYRLSQTGWETYSRIRNSYAMALDDMERVGMMEIARLYFNDPAVKVTVEEAIRNKIEPNMLRTTIEMFAQASPDPTLFPRLTKTLGELQQQFQEQRDKPYTPYPRFGQWAVSVKSQQGDLLHFETFESEADRNLGYMELQKQFPNQVVKPTYIEDTPYALQGMPPALLDVIQKRLNLDPQQAEAYQEMLKDLTHAQSFIRKTKHRKGVAGYSEDALRGYADYFRRYANYISRIKSSTEIKDGLDMLDEYAKGAPNETNARRLHEWFVEMNTYLQSPGNELSELKSAVALWHFAGNVSSAALNATQVPFVTLPYLAERHGWKETLAALTKAYKDLPKMYGDLSKLSSDEQAMINHSLDSGFMDQSFATTLAQMSDGSALTRISPMSRAQRATNKFAHYAMYPFAKVEEINRRVTALAAYRLNKTGKNMYQGFDADAFEAARQAVEDTQNEYSIENRPKFMRGNMSVILQFMHYSQNMVFMMLGGDSSWKKLLFTQLFLAGFMGLPFVGDALNALKAFFRIGLGKDFDVERSARELMREYDVNADLFLNGLASDVMGFDLSNRISLGDLIPGMSALGSHKKFNDALAMATGDVGGPAASLMLGIMKGLADDDPNVARRFEGVMPSAVRYGFQAARAMEAGAVEDRSGADLTPVSAFDTVGMSFGFKPKELMQAYRANSAQQEAANYWTQRRQALLTTYDYASQHLDAAMIQDIVSRIMDYNTETPDPSLRITSKSLAKSVKGREERRMQKEQGYGTGSTKFMNKELSDLYRTD